MLAADDERPRRKKTVCLACGYSYGMGRSNGDNSPGCWTEVRRLRDITPVVIADDIPLRNPEHRELLLSGLRLAAREAT